MLERVDATLEDLLLPPQKLDPAATADFALQDATSGDDAEPRDLDRRDDLDVALADLAIRRLAQALGSALHLFGQLVDDVVVTDLDLRPFRRGDPRRGRLEVGAQGH